MKRENQGILLMINDGEKWHYIALKKLSTLLRGITSKHIGDIYCLISFHAYCTEDKLKKLQNVCKNHGYFYEEMPKVDNKILKFNHGKNSVKVSFIIYAGTESLLEKMNTCHDNPENSSTVKINGHAPSGYSLFTHCSSDATKSKFGYYKGKNCMEIFCKDLKEHAVKIRDYQKGKRYH